MADSDTRPGASMNRAHPAATLNSLDWVSLLLMIIGGLNWGLVGAFDVDLVAMLLGNGTVPARVVYILVGLAALYGLVLMARLARGPVR